MKNKSLKQFIFSTTLVAAFAVMLPAAQAFITNGNVWPGSKPRIPVYASDCLNGNVPYDGTFQDALTAIQNATGEWNTAGGSEFQFDYRGTTSVCDVADDGINAVIFRDEAPTTPLRSAEIFYHETNNVFHGFDIVIYSMEGGTNNPVLWSVQNLFIWDADFQGTMTHELGHALGLDHSNFVTSVMGTSCGTGCTSNQTLTFDDIDGIQAIYTPHTNDGLWTNNTTPAPGETITLDLDYPLAAGKPYSIFMTLMNPGMDGYPLNLLTTNDSRMFPLGDGTGRLKLFPTHNFPSNFQNFNGILDGSGQATATVLIPNQPGLSGLQVYFGAITLDNTYLNGVEDLSVAVPITIQ